MKRLCCLFKLLLCISCLTATASLRVELAAPKPNGDKALIQLKMENTFTEKIESARAVVFLLNDQGKVVDQSTRWVIGGTKDKPALAPQAKTTYNFVVSNQKPFTSIKLSFTRVVLEGGNLADVTKDVIVYQVSK